ncbi:MAG TPA: DUF222 domain-containing protein, partial [Actinomycetota bacterium]|nr:DUF222 domain-containing protein [Actinomycetota bacterium]
MELARTLAGRVDDALDRMEAATAEALDALGAFDEAVEYRSDGHGACAEWLCARRAMSWATASELVRLARALRRLPEIAGAYRRGELCWDQLRPLCQVALAETDRAWAERAPRMSPAELWREVERQRQVRAERAADDRKARRLWMRWDPERRFLQVAGDLPGEQGVAFQAAVRRRAKEIPRDPEAFSPAEARQADAVVELVSASGGRPAPATVVVHADAKLLADAPPDGTRRLAETAEGLRLAAEAVRRLACDAQVELHLEREGHVVGIGRAGRAVPGWLLRAIEHRDA